MSSQESTDEEYDLRMFGIHQALPVPDREPDWSLGGDMDAEEYLLRVKHEASRCPQIVRVEIEPSRLAAPQTTYMDQLLTSDIEEGPLWAQMAPNWLARFFEDYRATRQRVQELGDCTDEGQEVGLEGWAQVTRGMADISLADFNPPVVVPMLQHMSQVAMASLFRQEVDQLVSSQQTSISDYHRLFSLSVFLTKPLSSDLAAAMRSMLRTCAALRARLSGPQDEALPVLNMLIAIAGGYFGQHEGLAQMVDLDWP